MDDFVDLESKGGIQFLPMPDHNDLCAADKITGKDSDYAFGKA
jgi:hypothetical protein